jgi:hypothetical protein
MKFLSRYKLLNGGALMLCRRFFGVWFDYQPHRNRIHEVETKMNAKVAELRKLHEQRRDLLAEENRIKNDILNSRECQAGYGVAFGKKLPLFPWRHKATPKPPEDWQPHSRIFDGKGASSVAESITRSANHTVVSVNGNPLTEDSGSMSSDDGVNVPITGEFIGSHDWDLNPRRNNRKGGNNKQQNNQQNNNQDNNN